MTGVTALFNLNGSRVEPGELRRMGTVLGRRGPDGFGTWADGPVGLGNAHLASSPEARIEAQPLICPSSGCVITADVRLDNRVELIDELGLRSVATGLSDAGVLLHAYLKWGQACPEHLVGDFACIIWDPNRRQLFCARDQMGMRPLYWHHSPGEFVVLASEPQAILVLPQVPYHLDEARVADSFFESLEGFDFTSTFFAGVHRLPPAHTFVVSPHGVRRRRYWHLEPTSELRLDSDEQYAEAFLEVFTQAVRSRLRSSGPVGSMLSGGMDSGAIVAVASRLLTDQGRDPLLTFSGTSPLGDGDVETRAIHATARATNITAQMIDLGDLGQLQPDLDRLSRDLDEPFDGNMNLIRAVYLTAQRAGVNVMLDGVAGDVILGDGTFLARLLRAGHLVSGVKEIRAQRTFWGDWMRTRTELVTNSHAAFTPEFVRRLVGPSRRQRSFRQAVETSLISTEFANRVDVIGRLEQESSSRRGGRLASLSHDRARSITGTSLAVGRERYDRVASQFGIEPRDPFMDRRVIDFCLRLPGDQLLHDGWPKIILRRAMAGLLPDEVRWRKGKQHLGWEFTKAVMQAQGAAMNPDIEPALSTLAEYVDPQKVRTTLATVRHRPDGDEIEAIYRLQWLASWLDHHRERPTV